MAWLSAVLAGGGVVSSPTAFLKPFSAAPKSAPNVRSLLVPNSKMINTAITRSLVILIPSILTFLFI
ncbi:hypothetical protein D3C76_1465350 [compost metagenome]